MATVAGVCNIALSRVGETSFIDSLLDETAQAQVCSVLWDHTVDLVLSSFPWTFATVRDEPAELSDDYLRDGWEYAYALPNDCLTVLRIYSGSRQTAPEDRPPFAIEGDETTKRVLLSDWEDPVVIYVQRVTDMARWSPLALDALAWRLAADLALSIPNKAQLATAALQSYYAAMAKAGASDMRQSQEDAQLDAEYIRIR